MAQACEEPAAKTGRQRPRIGSAKELLPPLKEPKDTYMSGAKEFATFAARQWPRVANRMVEKDIVARLGNKELFGDLPATQLEALEAMQIATSAPEHSTLYKEGDVPSGVFVLYSGAVELSLSGPGSRSVVLERAGPGRLLGLSATVSGKPYSVTARTIAPSRVGFLKRDEFLTFLKTYSEAAFRVAQLLSSSLNDTFERVRALGRSRVRRPRN
jgi:CRP-like cAMP-binding protein